MKNKTVKTQSVRSYQRRLGKLYADLEAGMTKSGHSDVQGEGAAAMHALDAALEFESPRREAVFVRELMKALHLAPQHRRAA